MPYIWSVYCFSFITKQKSAAGNKGSGLTVEASWRQSSRWGESVTVTHIDTRTLVSSLIKKYYGQHILHSIAKNNVRGMIIESETDWIELIM